MLFHSLSYLVFFPLVVAGYFVFPARWRWAFLLAASYYFYASWKPAYLLLIVASTLVDYVIGLRLGAEERPRRRRGWLIASLTVNLGLLFAFKYLNFFSGALGDAFRDLGIFVDVPQLDVLLPVGISFYTFQTISYSVDVYWRAREPERHLGRFALYVSFFPQLVAGPIERSTRLLPQFRRPTRLEWERLESGLGLILWGLFKKMVIADRAAQIVDAVYAHPNDFGGATLLIATYAFAFQIYGDFSGYSDIAVGSARVLGFDLMENFNRPYWATSIGDFWRRWHISLSTWFRDYLFIPLGGSRVGWRRRILNIVIVFLLSGLWHGANWTFLLWGAFHGLLLLLSIAASRLLDRRDAPLLPADGAVSLAARAARVLVTFHLVCLGWVMFRADNLSHFGAIMSRLPRASATSTLAELAIISQRPLSATLVSLGVLGLSVVGLEVIEHLRRSPARERIPTWGRWLGWATLCVWVGLTAVQSHSPFLYFQF